MWSQSLHTALGKHLEYRCGFRGDIIFRINLFSFVISNLVEPKFAIPLFEKIKKKYFLENYLFCKKSIPFFSKDPQSVSN